jgi:hypothetical protein
MEVQRTLPWEQKGQEWYFAPIKKSKKKRKVKTKDTLVN